MRRAVILAAAACGQSSAPKSEPIAQAQVAEAPPPEFNEDTIIDVGRSLAFGCVVRTSGAVDCWGQPIGGPPDPSMRRIPGIVDATAISDDGWCVLRKTGQIACIADDRLEFVTAEAHAGIASFGRDSHNCFVLKTGEAACAAWYDILAWERYEVFPGITDAVEIAGGEYYACVLRKTGELWCGDGNRDELPKLQPVQGLKDVQHVSTLPRAGLTCAVLKDSVNCFTQKGEPRAPRALAGVLDIVLESVDDYDNDAGQVYTALVNTELVRWKNNDEAKPFGVLSNIVALTPDCVLMHGGDIACWGSNESGALGQPTTIGRKLRPPTSVVGAQGVTKIVVTEDDRYAVTERRELLQWGRRSTSRATVLAVPPAAGAWSDVTATEAGTPCVIGNAGSVWCKLPGAAEFARVVEKEAISVAGESKTILVLKRDGSAERIRLDKDQNDYGQPPTQPAPLPPGTTRVIGWSYDRSCAVANDHLYCGKNWERVLGVEAATKISPRSIYGCAIVGPDVRCWNDSYDHGVVALTDVPAIRRATDVSTTLDHICAVIDGGKVMCWTFHKDDDALALLGKGAKAIELAPKDQALAGCILMTDQTVRCFGHNLYGELGDGSIMASETPVMIRGL